MQPQVKVPESIREKVMDCLWSNIAVGKSSDKVFRLQQSDGVTYFLKIAHKLPLRDLQAEAEVLKWLADKLPVPEVIRFDEDDDRDYLLISGLPGVDTDSLIGEMDNVKLVKLLARGLRQIHRIPVENCPFDRTLDTVMKLAWFNVQNDLVEDGDFDDFRQGTTSEALYDELVRKKPANEDLVFTHGDYCPPNIIIQENEISGFIDVHRAGIADRYQDIALAIRSVNSHIGPDLETHFFSEYGIDNPDTEKVEYYQLLDEFF